MTYYICHLLDTESNQLEKYSWYLSCCVHFIAVFAPFISLGIEDKSHHIVQILCMYSIIISIFTIYCTISEKRSDTILDGTIFKSSRLQKRLDHHKPYLIIYLTDFGSAGTDEPYECHTSKHSGTVLYSSPNRIKSNSELKAENLSQYTQAKSGKLSFETTTNASAAHYFNPRRHGQADDAWALGVTLIELITGELPINKHDPFKDILKGKIHFMKYFYKATKSYKSHIPVFLYTLIDRCLENDPKKRWTFRDIILHPDYDFIKKNFGRRHNQPANKSRNTCRDNNIIYYLQRFHYANLIRPPFRSSILEFLNDRQFFAKEKLSSLDQCNDTVLIRSLLAWLIVFNVVIVQVLVVFLNFCY